MNFVIGAIFIVLSAMWMAAFGWAGKELEGWLKGSKNVQGTAGKAGDTLSGVIEK